MDMSRPPEDRKRIPLWARLSTQHRWGLILAVLVACAGGVVLFEIVPMMIRPPERHAPRAPLPAAWAARPGAPKELIFEGVLDRVKDGEPLAQQEEPYYYLVRSLARPGVTAEAGRPVDYRWFKDDPAALRGRTVRILALFVQTMPQRMERPESGVEWIYRTWLVDTSGDEGYVVDLLERPPALERRAIVQVDAVFMRMASYESNDSKRGFIQAPFFLAKGVLPVKEKFVPASVEMGKVVFGLAVASVVGAIVLSILVFRNTRPRSPRPMPKETEA